MLSEKVIVITGASSGIGRACTVSLLEEGADVAVFARNQKQLEFLQKNCQERGLKSVLVYSGDVTQSQDCSSLISEVLKRYERIDVLINNAGIGLFRKSWDTSIEEYQHLMNVNFFGAVRLIQEVLPVFMKQESGHIVNVISVAGRRAFPDVSAYCASKFALRGFGEGLRQDLKEACPAVKVSQICPVATRTPFFEKAGSPDYEKRHQYTQVMDPETVAKEILKVIERGKGEDLILTRRAQIIDKIHGVFPSFIEWLNAKALQKSQK